MTEVLTLKERPRLRLDGGFVIRGEVGVKLQELEEIIKNTELISIYIKVMMMVHMGIVIMRGSNDRGADTDGGANTEAEWRPTRRGRMRQLMGSDLSTDGKEGRKASGQYCVRGQYGEVGMKVGWVGDSSWR